MSDMEIYRHLDASPDFFLGRIETVFLPSLETRVLLQGGKCFLAAVHTQSRLVASDGALAGHRGLFGKPAKLRPNRLVKGWGTRIGAAEIPPSLTVRDEALARAVLEIGEAEN